MQGTVGGGVLIIVRDNVLALFQLVLSYLLHSVKAYLLHTMCPVLDLMSLLLLKEFLKSATAASKSGKQNLPSGDSALEAGVPALSLDCLKLIAVPVLALLFSPHPSSGMWRKKTK